MCLRGRNSIRWEEPPPDAFMSARSASAVGLNRSAVYARALIPENDADRDRHPHQPIISDGL